MPRISEGFAAWEPDWTVLRRIRTLGGLASYAEVHGLPFELVAFVVLTDMELNRDQWPEAAAEPVPMAEGARVGAVFRAGGQVVVVLREPNRRGQVYVRPVADEPFELRIPRFVPADRLRETDVKICSCTGVEDSHLEAWHEAGHRRYDRPQGGQEA